LDRNKPGQWPIIDLARAGRVSGAFYRPALILLFAQFDEYLHDSIKSLVYLSYLSVNLLVKLVNSLV